MWDKVDRTGEENINNQGEQMVIIYYQNANDITVFFKDTQTTKRCAYKEFKKGSVKDNFYPSVFGIGYIGNTTVSEGNRIVKKSYKIWEEILKRCYVYTEQNPAYKDCTICDEWLCYANFEKWYKENYYEISNEKMHLDKDILIKGNKLYSPETCIFVPQRINALFTKRAAKRGKYPIGVTFSNKANKYEPQVQGRKWLGYFDNPYDAFLIYKKEKELRIKEIADEYKDKIPQKLYNAMYSYEVEITD